MSRDDSVAATPSPWELIEGDSLTFGLPELDLLFGRKRYIDLCVTDPPYAFGGSGGEHELSATVAVVLRETAQRLNPGSWMVVFAASSWRSTSYMVDALRGVVEPVRIGTWVKPESRTKVATSGWRWASVNAIAFRRGKTRDLEASSLLDHITAAPVKNGRRAELPPEVAEWAVKPFAVPGVFLDPFAGAGIIPEAAARAGMQAYGFERAPLRVSHYVLPDIHATLCAVHATGHGDCTCGADPVLFTSTGERRAIAS